MTRQETIDKVTAGLKEVPMMGPGNFATALVDALVALEEITVDPEPAAAAEEPHVTTKASRRGA
jgi:hypothetical protein